MKEEKNKCKALCLECENMREYIEGEYTCVEFPIKKMNCVDGTSSCEYDLCVNHNEKGDCNKYRTDKERIQTQKLIKSLHEYYGEKSSYPDSFRGRDGRILRLIGELGNSLKNKYYSPRPLCYGGKDKRRKHKCGYD